MRPLPLGIRSKAPCCSAGAQDARHDAVAWGYARAADALGVDIVQNCEVTGFLREGDSVVGVDTTRGQIRAPKVALAVAGHSSVLAAKAGFRLPVTSYALQAFVTEPLKPVLSCVAISMATGTYASASLTRVSSWSAAVSICTPHMLSAAISRLCSGWCAGSSSSSPLSAACGCYASGPASSMWCTTLLRSSTTPVKGIYLNCGWGTGGFKAIPGGGVAFAHLLATDRPHPAAAAFTLRRFASGALIDEGAAAGISH